MSPSIREILDPIYPGQLDDHETVFDREPVQGMGDVNVYWFSHCEPESTMEDTPSKCNKFEAEMITKFVEYLVLNGIQPEKITILTYYTGQRQMIMRMLRQNTDLKNKVFKIATVDSYQGEENDVVILSLVRSNGDQNIGFLSNENRVCVALSRAQRGFYIFGNAAMITSADKLWWDIGAIFNRAPTKIGYSIPLTCANHGEQTRIGSLIDWEDINAGCRAMCKAMMECGHECPIRCHPFTHEVYRCLENCIKELKCGHPCTERCYKKVCSCETCGDVQDLDIMEDKTTTPANNAWEEKEGKEGEGDAAAQNRGFDNIPRPLDRPPRRIGRNYQLR